MDRRYAGIDSRPKAVKNVDLLELGILSQAEADDLIRV